VPYTGEWAALATVPCWTLSTLAFEAAGRRVGSMNVNLVRLVVAWGMLALYGWAFRGLPLPVDASADTWLWMSISGFVGFFLCDMCLFRAWVLMGPRVTLLVFSSMNPPLAVLLGWLIVGEALTWAQWLGMAMTLGGVTWVLAERQIRATVRTWHISAWSVTLALAAALGQAAATVLIKKGPRDYDPCAITQIRVIAGIAGFVVLFAAIRWYRRLWRGMRDTRAMGLASLGALFGPVMGVSLLTLSLRYLPSGVALTFVATLPVVILPFTMIIYKEHVTRRAAAGAGITVAGVAMLFL